MFSGRSMVRAAGPVRDLYASGARDSQQGQIAASCYGLVALGEQRRAKAFELGASAGTLPTVLRKAEKKRKEDSYEQNR